jgi:hypothetical protein
MINQKLSTMTKTEILNNKEYTYLGEGTSRQIFQISDEFIVKIPLNQIGVLQNNAEGSIFTNMLNTIYECLLAPCTLVKETNLLFMKKAMAIPANIHITISEYLKLNFPHISYPERSLIRDFIYKAHLHLDDIYSNDSWGIINNKIFIIDYGCTSNIFQNYY